MRFLAGLLIAVLFTALLREPLRKVPAVFYLISALLCVPFLLGDVLNYPSWVREYVLFLFQSNTLGMGFFTIVMFIGVLDSQSKLRKALVPVRAELSILATILSIGHMFKYGESYLTQLLSVSTYTPAIRYWMLGTAIALVILLVPLAVTSIKRIHARMGQKSWQRLQRLAYLFFGLVFVHIILCLATPALGGSSSAIISMCVYLVLGVLYAALRIRLYLRLRNKHLQERPAQVVS